MARPKGGYSDVYEPGPRDLVALLDVRPTTVLVTRGDGWTAEVAQDLRHALGPEVLVIHLAAEGDSIEALDDDEMRAAGWVRA